MREIRVHYHHELEGWWAQTADLPGYSAWGADLDEVMELVKDGVPFFAADLGITDFHLVHVAPMANALETSVYTAAGGSLVGMVAANYVWRSPQEPLSAGHPVTGGIKATTC